MKHFYKTSLSLLTVAVMLLLSAMPASALDYTLSITPSPDGGPYTPDDFKEIRIHCPECKFMATSDTYRIANGVYLSNGLMVRCFKYLRTEDDGHTMVLTIQDNYAKGTVDPAFWDSDTYSITFQTQYCYMCKYDGDTLVESKFNTHHQFTGFQIQANDKAKGLPVYPSDTEGAALERIDQLQIKFFCKSKANDETKKVTITRDGNPVWSTSVNNPTANAAKKTGNGALNITYKVNPALTEPGTYQVIYDEDAFIQVEAAKHTSAQHTFSYVIPETIEHSVIPAPAVGKRENNQLVLESNGAIDKFGEFTITYPEGAVVELTDNCETAISKGLFNNAVVTSAQAFVDAPQSATNIVPQTGLEIKAEGNVVTVKYAAESYRATGPGQFWRQTIPVGAWSITLGGKTTLNNQEYIYWQIPDIVNVSVAPVTDGDFSSLKYSGYNNIQIFNTDKGLPVLKKGNRVVATYAGPAKAAAPYNQPIFTTTDDLNGVKGNCVFEIPAGYLGLDAVRNTFASYWANPTVLHIPVTLPGIPEIKYLMTPTEDTNDFSHLKEIKIHFHEASEVLVADGARPTLTKPDGSVLNGVIETSVDEPTSIRCRFDTDEWTNGNYQFNIAPNMLTVDGDPLTDGISANYIRSLHENGIENITVTALPDKVDIYTIAGLLLHHNADKSILETLPRGIYIVNGQKFISRKTTD